MCNLYGIVFLRITTDGNLRLTNNPGFDYELEKNYKITVYVDDGVNIGAPGYVYITITDVNEPPIILNLPTYTNLPENSKEGKTVFIVRNKKSLPG